MPSPREPRLVLLLPCIKCEGEGYYLDENEDIYNCPRCENGWQSAAVPIRMLFSIYRTAYPADQQAEELADFVRTLEPTGHSLLSHQSDDLPASALQKLREKCPTLSGAPASPVNNVEQSDE